MAILVANLGTSDLTLKPDGIDFFLPVRLEAQEKKSLHQPDPGSAEAQVWASHETHLRDFYAKELDIPIDKNARNQVQFRALTETLLARYQQDPDHWRSRIRPGRILGAIQMAYRHFEVRQFHLISTDQPVEQIRGHLHDTVHLGTLLQKWLSQELQDATITVESIPKTIAAIDEDSLAQFYADLFQRFSQKHSRIIVVTKGGTSQMRNALFMQAIAPRVAEQISLDPQLDILSVLHGKPSSCEVISFWQTIQNQRYQTLKSLLDRWDFEGASAVLKDWQTSLTFWQQHQVIESLAIQQAQTTVEQVLAMLQVAIAFLNFDHEAVKNQLNQEPLKSLNADQLPAIQDWMQAKLSVHLYAQCQIYNTLGQTANVLSRVGSFYEAILNEAIAVLGGLPYFDASQPGKWVLNAKDIHARHPTLWEAFANLPVRFGDNLNRPYQTWNFNRKPTVLLSNRFSKRNFVEALIVSNPAWNNDLWIQFYRRIRQLDFWYDLRNELIHQSRCGSPQRMDEIYAQRPHKVEYIIACAYHDLFDVMQTIWKMVHEDWTTQQGHNAPVQYQPGDSVYDEIQSWAIDQLMAKSGVGNKSTTND